MKPLSSETAKYFTPLKFDPHDRLHLTADNTGRVFNIQAWNQWRGNDRDGNPIKDQPSSAAYSLITRLPEKDRRTSFGCPCVYDAPNTDYTCDLIHSLFPQEQMTFHSQKCSDLFYGTVLESMNADQNAEIAAAYKERKEVPEHEWEFCGEEDKSLSPYQQIGLCNVMRSVWPMGGYSLFMEQGTGKTPIVVAAVCNLAKLWKQLGHKRMYRVLIICPNNVRANWENEFLKFATQPGKISTMRGPDIGRVKQIYDAGRRDDRNDLYTVLITGYDTAKKSVAALTGQWDLGIETDDEKPIENTKAIVWDLVVLDESQFIKSCKTKRWEAMEHIRDASTSHLVLTGTPIANTQLDLYTQFEFLGKGYSGFSDFSGFRNFYGVFEVNSSGHQALVDVQNLPFMRERLARYAYMIRLKEALPDLPDKLYDLREVEMSGDQADYYETVATQLAVEIERDLCNDNMPRSMKINHILTKLLRLAQITSGFMSWQPVVSDDGETLIDKRIEYFHPNPKIEALRELATEPGGGGDAQHSKKLIWACFKPDIEFIYDALTDDGFQCVKFYGATSDAERKEAEHRFNFDPNCRVFVGNPAAGGTGLNLLGFPPGAPGEYETNCDHIIYYSQNWSSLNRSQSEFRANRRGTRVPTRITDLLCPQTIDETIRTRVVEKQMMAMDVTDLRRILTNVFRSIEEFDL